MNTSVVSGGTQETQQQATQQQQQQQQQPNAEVETMRRQLEELKAQNEEFKNTAQYWHDEAKRKPAAAAPVKQAEGDDDIDLVEVMTTKGVKGLIEVVKKHGGLVSKEEAESMVNSKAASMTKEQELLGDYPQLKDRSSEFFKDTAKAYGALVNGGVPAHLAMELAAKQTELDHIQSGKLKSKPAQTADYAAAKEQRRLARIAAQSGDRGAAPASEEAEDDELTPQQKQICAQMGISEEAYKKRAVSLQTYGRARR